jgi:hypothetical protein
VPRPLDGRRQPALMESAIPRNPPWDDLAPFIYKSLQQAIIMIVDMSDFIFTKAAHPAFLSSEFRHFESSAAPDRPCRFHHSCHFFTPEILFFVCL